MRRALVSVSVAAGTAILLPAGCYSSSSPGTSTQDAACAAVDATITASISASASPCNACIQAKCETNPNLVALCANECVCNDTALGALSCLDNLGGNASIAAVTTCLAPLANASDQQLSALGGCVTSNCLAACAGEPSDGAACDAVGTSLTSLLDSGTGACESCLQTSCQAAVTTCAADCACNAATVTSLECLANLGDAATFASAAACLGSLQSAANTATGALVVCLGSACGATCGLTAPDGGIDASAPGDSSTMDVIITGAPDVGTDAPCPTCTGGVCCQQTELTSTMDAPVAFWLDGTTLFWTANSASGAGEILSFVEPPGVSTGLVTLLSTAGHTYGALGGSSTNLFFVDQTAGGVMTMPKTTGTVSVVATGAGAGVAVQSAADGGTGATVYFGGTSAVSWVPFPGAGSPTAAINLDATQVALDATNVYGVGLVGAGACPLGQGSASSSALTFSSGTLSYGQGIFADAGGNVWIADEGTAPNVPSSTGAIYKCSAATGACGAPFISGRNHPFAVVADGVNVYWTEAYQGGGIMRCPVSGCVSGPEAVAHAFETPTALVQDAVRIYWADVNNISMLVK